MTGETNVQGSYTYPVTISGAIGQKKKSPETMNNRSLIDPHGESETDANIDAYQMAVCINYEGTRYIEEVTTAKKGDKYNIDMRNYGAQRNPLEASRYQAMVNKCISAFQ
jgi:hypothetical protein